MKKTVVSAIAGVALFSGAAMAQEIAKPFSVDLSADTYYNVDTEQAIAELSAGASAMNFSVSWNPDIDIEEVDLIGSDITIGYSLNLVKNISITPYGTLEFDGDFNTGDTIVGVKSSFSF